MDEALTGLATGDLMFFSGDQWTGYFIKLGTGCPWNHLGIAAWIDNGKITRDSGVLSVLEINSEERYDLLTNRLTRGPSFTSVDIVKSRYYCLGVRKLNEAYRDQMILYLSDSCRQYNNLIFSKKTSKFLNGWIGSLLPARYSTDLEKDGVFCSELVAMIYSYCLNQPIGEILEISQIDPHICTPATYLYANSPNSEVFCGKEIIYDGRSYWPVIAIILVIIIIIIVIVIIILCIYYSQRSSKEHK